ncbi:hypothetical protein ACHAWF_017452, partial [Thalassiosira exigua]
MHCHLPLPVPSAHPVPLPIAIACHCNQVARRAPPRPAPLPPPPPPRRRRSGAFRGGGPVEQQRGRAWHCVRPKKSDRPRSVAMKRCFEQKDSLANLLAAPTRTNRGASDGSGNGYVRRLAEALGDGRASQVSALEVKLLFQSLAEECQQDRSIESVADCDDAVRSSSLDLSPRKRRRRSPENNLHSMLRFVERVVDRRYGMSRGKFENEDDEFLKNELKIFFGTKDASFQAEEEVICVAFEMATNAIMMSSEQFAIAGIGEMCVENDQKDDGQDPEEDAPAPVQGAGAGTLSNGVIKTALRIVDALVRFDRRERTSRQQLQATKDSQMLFKANASDRRTKYEHLLPRTKKRPLNGQPLHGAKRSDVATVFEEKYPDQWKLLNQFRGSLVSKSEATIPTELQRSHFPNSAPGKTDDDSDMNGAATNTQTSLSREKDERPLSNFVILRRKIMSLDDILLSSDDSDVEMRDKVEKAAAKEVGDGPSEGANLDELDMAEAPSKTSSSQSETVSAIHTEPATTSEKTPSPLDKLDQEAHELRLSLLDMPPSDSSLPEVVQHTVDEIGSLLSRYGELDGAAGIARCGDVFGGNGATDLGGSSADTTTNDVADVRFPLNDAMVSSLVKEFLTDATGALRANAFLRSFALPLVIEMNPVAKAVAATDPTADGQKAVGDKGKPASRLLTSLPATLARDRPTECVLSVLIPSLPYLNLRTRFQYELISRVLRGKDALSVSTIAFIVEEGLPTVEAASATDAPTRGGMKWTENTIPLLTACLNRQPCLTDEVVARLADEMAYHLSPKSSQMMAKSMKFSTLFHALVT